jgi:large subunit ribosomal protein L6
MSRIGNAIITIPAGVDIKVDGTNVSVKGPLGELHQQIDSAITVKIEDGVLSCIRANEEKQTKANHGLFRSLIFNMIEGVLKGWEKKMELVGVGFRAAVKGQQLNLTLGFSHNISFMLPEEVKAEVLAERGKNPVITFKSYDKQLIGQVCAKVRSLRKPEPYKGKGIRFVGEHIRRKAGKSAATA